MIKPEVVKEARSRLGARLTATPPAAWAKLGGGLLLGGLVVGWIAFPYVLDKVVASQINLSQGKDSRKLWMQLPPFDFNIYVFNITNPAEIMKGAKPTVQQVGPYCYTEIKDKVDIIEDLATDTISYSARSTWYENQKGPRCKAPQLTGDEILVVPNIPLLAILLLAKKDFPPALLALVNQALPAIFGPLPDVFSRVSARRLLFDGLPIDCSPSALAPRAVCIALKQNSRALKKLGNNKYLFSFFGHKNNTPEEFRYTVKRGAQDGQEIGKLVAMDGKGELPFWRGACNKLQGTDATVFPPFRTMENGSLTAYSSEVCRIVFGVYEGQFDYKGVTGYGYSVTFGDIESNAADRCFCPADNRCWKNGVLDAFKCQGAPIVSSLPHFYQANQDYVTGVNGLSPDKEKHGILIVLEPISGSPLMVRKRLQFNIDMKPVRFVPLTQRLRRTLLPLFWAEEMLNLDNDLMGMLEASLFRPIRAVDVLKWGSVAAGVGLAVGAAALKARNMRRDKVHVLDGERAEIAKDREGGPQMVLRNGQVDTKEELDPFYVNSQEARNPSEKNFPMDVGLVRSSPPMLSLGDITDRSTTLLRNNPSLNTPIDGVILRPAFQTVDDSGGNNSSVRGELVGRSSPPIISINKKNDASLWNNPAMLNTTSNGIILRPATETVDDSRGTNNLPVGEELVMSSNTVTGNGIDKEITNINSTNYFPTLRTIQKESLRADPPYEDQDRSNEKIEGLKTHDLFGPFISEAITGNEYGHDGVHQTNSPPNHFSFHPEPGLSVNSLLTNILSTDQDSTHSQFQINNDIALNDAEKTLAYSNNTHLTNNDELIEPTDDLFTANSNTKIHLQSKKTECINLIPKEIGKVIDNKSISVNISSTTSADSIYNDKVISNEPPFTDKYKKMSDNPTEEEIRLVEQDINELVVEIRQLFHKI